MTLKDFTRSELGDNFSEIVDKAFSTMIKNGRSITAAKLIKSLFLNKKCTFKIDDIKKYKNINITKAIIESQDKPEDFVKKNFFKLIRIHEPNELVQIHEKFKEQFNIYLYNELSELDFNKQNPIQKEKLIYIKSVIESIIKDISIYTILSYLNFENDTKLAKKYIVNCSNKIDDKKIKYASDRLFTCFNENKNLDLNYFKTIIETLIFKYGDSIIFKILKDFIKKDEVPNTHNHIKNIFLNYKIESSEINLDFIKQNKSLLNIDDVVKIILKQNINKNKVYDFIMECNNRLDENTIKNLDFCLWKYYYKNDQKDEKILSYIFRIIYVKFKNESDSLFIKLLKLCDKEKYSSLYYLIKNNFLSNKYHMDNINKEFIIENNFLFDIKTILNFIEVNNLTDDKIEELIINAISNINESTLKSMCNILINYFYENSEKKDVILKKVIKILDNKFENKFTKKLNEICEELTLNSVLKFLNK